MVENYFSFLEYINKTKMPIYKKKNILIYIIITLYKIMSIFKCFILGGEKIKSFNFFRGIVSLFTLPFNKNDFFKVKNKRIFKPIIKKRKFETKNNNTIKRNSIIKILIGFIIINSFCFLKSNFLFCLSFYSSKITLKIKGTGYNYIIGNDPYNEYVYFRSISFLKKVYINGEEQDRNSNKYYFNQTDNIVELEWYDNIIDCGYMFYKCFNITEINLSNFDSSLVKNMNHMFYNCSSLISLDLFNFDTSKVMDMEYMFYGCSSLPSLNLNNFDTSNVTNMQFMFYGCSSLTSLNLSSFDTSKVCSMWDMFYGCSSLTSLNLSSFDTSMVYDIEKMFYGCIKLEYINMNNFNEKNVENDEYYYDYLFYNVPENVVICINTVSNKNKILPQITKKNCYAIDCSNDWKSKQKKIIFNTNECIESCDKNPIYKYEYKAKCYECKCELEECSLNPNISLINGLCKKCKSNYFHLEKEQSRTDEYNVCYNKPEGYYLDNNIYKKCYEVCKSCNKSGNNSEHNCLECKPNFKLEIKHNDYINCYKECKYYYYFDDENNFHCTDDFSCPKEYPRLNKTNNKCDKYNFENIMKNLKENDLKNMSKEEEINFYDNFRKKIEKILTTSILMIMLWNILN